MTEKENYMFMDVSGLKETEGIRERCTKEFVQKELQERFPEEEIEVVSVEINTTGKYKKCMNLPDYCDVRLSHKQGNVYDEFIIWSPLAWNDKFAGTGGGGTSTGGESHIGPQNNTVRGLKLPYALCNGFTTATGDAKNETSLKDFMLDKKTGEINVGLYEDWRVLTTHNMTRFGKAVAEILHNRKVKYSFYHGGSGGGRQGMMEAQEYPEDYDGIWVSCPGINWCKLLPTGLWGIVVMNEKKHVVSPDKFKYYTEKIWEQNGGKEEFFKIKHRVYLDPYSLVGEQTKSGLFTKEDAEVIQTYFEGPKRKDGTRLWYAYRPGTVFWSVGLPIGGISYTLFKKRPKPFIVSKRFCRWVVQDAKENFKGMTQDEFEKLYDKCVNEFGSALADNPDLSKFMKRGGKLILDHGTNDPIIPMDGTLDYMKRVRETMGKETVDDFFKLYLSAGDGHGNCFCDGPGITQSAGLKALVEWVEEGKEPGALRAVRVNKKTGELLEETQVEPVDDLSVWE